MIMHKVHFHIVICRWRQNEFDWHNQKQNYLKSDWMLCWVIMTGIFLKSDWMTSGHVTRDVLLSHHDKPDNFNFPEIFSGSRKIRAACRREFWCNFHRSFRICSPFWSSMHWNASYALGENRFFPVLTGKSGFVRNRNSQSTTHFGCSTYVPSFIPIPQANQKLEGGTDRHTDALTNA